MVTDKQISFVQIDELPEMSGRKGPRNSVCLEAYLAAKAAPSHTIEAKGPEEEMDKFYKSMVQWRNRHKEFGVQVRKDGPRVYVWIVEDETIQAKPKTARKMRD